MVRWKKYTGQGVGKGAQSFHALPEHATALAPPRAHTLWKLSEPHTFGISMEASSHWHDGSLTPFPAHLLSLENMGWG